ncbi:InlB B-repeat-containing protein [Bifidobacterium adolescentis]|uniref:InlB B-repeat-containing protein n=1 Tax=Bifidobacterium adolescentis TaxID=1680 RepID=UPI0022E6AFC9|nr:InlB B-repeat-containing protein [Bifidobacterium adolescentis]
MGFLTRLLAGLVAASTLGAGLAGTANAVDVTGATGNTKSVVKLTADDTNNLPDHIVNGRFGYPSVPSWTTLGEPASNKYNKGKLFATINPGTGKYGSGCAMSTTGRAIPNWNRSSFAWSSTQGDTHYSGGMSCEAGNVELNYDSVHHNQFAELTADQQGTAIYQDVKVTPGTMMKWSLKHSSATSAYVDKMQVMIGEPYKETAQEATRIASENGNKVGEKMTTISTPTTSDRADNKKWDTYSGAYLVPDGVTTVRFTFKSVASAEWYSGNDLDDIKFSRSYKLTYDKNSSDATGSVPSNQRGRENTVQPAESKTNGTVKTVADDTSNLPDHLVNGDFEYPGANVLNEKGNWWGVSRKDRMVFAPQPRWVSLPSTFDSDKFAWDSTEVARVQNESSQWHTNEVELQRDSRTGNMYAELCAYQAHTSIRQYIHTTPGTLYKVRLKHASLSRDYLDKMQVLIGPDGNEQPVRMTRVESQNGLDATGESTASTTVSTHASNEMEIKDGQGPYSSRNHDGQWATYEGAYVATSDVTSFTFKSVDAKAYNLGNLLDDIVFDKAYRLSYDKNATDANGSVPSDETAGATKQAKSKTNGSVRLAADDDVAEYAANGLPEQIMNGDFDHDWRNIVGQSKMTGKYNFANIDPAHGDVEISGALNGKGEASKQWVHLNGFDANKFGWKSNQTDTRVDGRGGIVEIQRSKANDNMYAEITASQANTYLYQDIDTAHSTPTVYTVKLRYAHRNGSINSNEKIQILVGAPGHEQPVEMTRIASDRGNKVGEKSTTVNAPNTDGWLGSWDTFQGSVEIPAGQPVSRFTFKALGSIDGVTGNLIDDVQFKLAYKLSYDKNSQDASGQIPSDETANTVKQAKAKSSGGVRLAADRTDGKVSDLVQRTTTHEDGSVTVRTVDQSTDVVSGCQVYYPAGQRITLATLAKDDDCWDSSMLTRPGHTQLGWNQDRNATQAQAQVTMVEGGMTVYAVWVGNPVLTYDTNKPSTWSGQMPSTPASVSVPYNTAAADGSGWRAGDTTKIRGYRFLGWYTAPQDNAGLYDWTRPLTGSVTVYAHWQRLQANVVYNANGGTGSHPNTTGWQYSDVTIPGDTSKSFKRTGYRFAGWNTAKDGKGTAYVDGSKVPLQDRGVTLYAQWKPLFDVLPSAGGDYGPSVPWLVCGGLALVALAGGVASTLLRLRRARGAHSR